jgi:hypothetical protein
MWGNRYRAFETIPPDRGLVTAFLGPSPTGVRQVDLPQIGHVELLPIYHRMLLDADERYWEKEAIPLLRPCIAGS